MSNLVPAGHVFVINKLKKTVLNSLVLIKNKSWQTQMLSGIIYNLVMFCLAMLFSKRVIQAFLKRSRLVQYEMLTDATKC